MTVTVSPAEFNFVNFVGADVIRIAERLRDEVALPPDLDVRIEIDESSPAARAGITSIDPLVITVEGGAFENPKKIRTLSEINVTDVLGILFLQACDRLEAGFGAPEPQTEVSLPHRVAWDITAAGRLGRLGHPVQRPRRLYQFRNRHGFSDAADAAFEQLWAGRPETWVAMAGASDDARLASNPA